MNKVLTIDEMLALPDDEYKAYFAGIERKCSPVRVGSVWQSKHGGQSVTVMWSLDGHVGISFGGVSATKSYTVEHLREHYIQL